MNKKLTSVEKATSTILNNIPVLSSYEEIVLNSLGKTLAKPVTALLSNPPSNVSSMDGYALKNSDIENIFYNEFRKGIYYWIDVVKLIKLFKNTSPALEDFSGWN